MKKYLNNTLDMLSLRAILSFLLLVSCCFFAGNSIAQVTNFQKLDDEHYTVSKFLHFGQSIEDYSAELNENTAWKIISKANQQVLTKGVGKELTNFKFDIPGKYNVEIEDKNHHDVDNCDHKTLPSSIHVEVSGVQMTYDFTRIKFSEKIVKGVKCDQITVSVPVRVVLFDEKPVTFNIPDIRTAGIGTEIIAVPVRRQIELVNGEQILNFTLTGVARNEAYIMFDFVDVNNQVQSYSHLEYIK